MYKSTFEKIMWGCVLVIMAPIFMTIGALYGVYKSINWMIDYWNTRSAEATGKYGFEQIRFGK